MNAQSTVAKRERIGGRWPPAGGALAFWPWQAGWRSDWVAVVDRLTMPDEGGSRALSWSGQDSMIASAAGVAGRSNKELHGRGAHVDRSLVDRRSVEQDGATALEFAGDQYQFRRRRNPIIGSV